MHSSQKVKVRNRNLDESLSIAKNILSQYSLCEHCIGRLFGKKFRVSSNQILGKKIFTRLNLKPSKNCYICKGILSNLQSIVSKLSEKSSEHVFSTFVVGAILKPSVTDRDDLIRSKFKLQGIDSVKTSITQEISKKFSKKTHKKIDFLSPDLTFTFNFRNDSCELKSRSILFSGRYVKKIRGLPQKQIPCSNCKRKGCLQCNYHGISEFSSVEGKISKFLYEKFLGKQTKITWLGGEDQNSLVLGNGRPFFAKLSDPIKRNIRLKKKYVLDGIEIHNLKIISKIPNHQIPFTSTIQLSILSNENLTQKNLVNLKKLKKSSVTIFEKPNKKHLKSVHEIKYKKNNAKSFFLWITAESGFPVKRFVEGNSVHPNVSELLGTTCKCKEFDFQRVDLPNF